MSSSSPGNLGKQIACLELGYVGIPRNLGRVSRIDGGRAADAADADGKPPRRPEVARLRCSEGYGRRREEGRGGCGGGGSSRHRRRRQEWRGGGVVAIAGGRIRTCRLSPPDERVKGALRQAGPGRAEPTWTHLSFVLVAGRV